MDRLRSGSTISAGARESFFIEDSRQLGNSFQEKGTRKKRLPESSCPRGAEDLAFPGAIGRSSPPSPGASLLGVNYGNRSAPLASMRANMLRGPQERRSKRNPPCRPIRAGY